MHPSSPKPKRKRTIVGNPFVVLLLALVCGVALYWLSGMYKKYRQAMHTKATYMQERDELLQKKQELTASIANLESERGREEEIRSRFRAVKPGETLIIVVDSEGNELKEQVRPKQGFFRRTWEKITCLFKAAC